MTVFGIDPIVSLLIGMPVLFVIGFTIQKYLFNKAYRISMDTVLIIAFGISIILENIFIKLWTPMSRSLTTSYALKSFNIGHFRFPFVYLLDFLVARVCRNPTVVVLDSCALYFLHRSLIRRLEKTFT